MLQVILKKKEKKRLVASLAYSVKDCKGTEKKKKKNIGIGKPFCFNRRKLQILRDEKLPI